MQENDLWLRWWRRAAYGKWYSTFSHWSPWLSLTKTPAVLDVSFCVAFIPTTSDKIEWMRVTIWYICQHTPWSLDHKPQGLFNRCERFPWSNHQSVHCGDVQWTRRYIPKLVHPVWPPFKVWLPIFVGRYSLSMGLLSIYRQSLCFLANA